MDDIKRMLYLQQKFMILSLFTNRSADRVPCPAVAYAWDADVYPFLSSGEWHKPYAEEFEVRENQIEGLFKLLADRWDEGKPISFYELEDHYGVRGSAHPGPLWSRFTLIHACRYIHLVEGRFDRKFWSALIENGKCPAEAHGILDPFTPDDVYFS